MQISNLTKDGCPPPAMSLSRFKFTLEEFIGFWEMSPSVEFAAEALKITPEECEEIAFAYMDRGLPLRLMSIEDGPLQPDEFVAPPYRP